MEELESARLGHQLDVLNEEQGAQNDFHVFVSDTEFEEMLLIERQNTEENGFQRRWI